MPDFDLTKTPAETTQLLMSRGAGLPPLLWQEHQNPLAKKTLDSIQDAKLCGNAPLRDEAMAGAVRALLYLWTGWPTEASMYAQVAPQKEQMYIAALAERQLGHPAKAKELFQKMAGHEIYDSLTDFLIDQTKPENDPAIKRFRGIIELAHEWEAHAFIDLCEQARAGKVSPVGELVVRNLQAKEFELLFAHCYRAATGQDITKRRVMSEAEEQRREQEYRRRMAERRKANEKRSQKLTEAAKQELEKLDKAEPKSKPATAQPPKKAAPDPRVKVLCPACGHLMFVPESGRGKRAECIKCRAAFLVPPKKDNAPISATTKG